MALLYVKHRYRKAQEYYRRDRLLRFAIIFTFSLYTLAFIPRLTCNRYSFQLNFTLHIVEDDDERNDN